MSIVLRLLPFLLLFLFPAPLRAGEPYASPSGIFQVLFPDPPASKITTFRISEKALAGTEETNAFKTQKPFRNQSKNAIVKFKQTLGPALNRGEIASFLDREIELYRTLYTVPGARIDSVKKTSHAGFPAAEIRASYSVPGLDGPQSMAAYVLFTDSTQIEQIVMGPESIMDTYKTKEFFESLRVEDGLQKKPGRFELEWKTLITPSGLFSVILPPKTEPFVPYDPLTQYDSGKEIIGSVFYDPLWNQQIFYNAYGYVTNDILTFHGAQEWVIENHLPRYNHGGQLPRFTRTEIEGAPALTSEFPVTPPKKYPYANYVRLRIRFAKNTLLLEEIFGARRLAESAFLNNVIGLTKFHPADSIPPVSESPL